MLTNYGTIIALFGGLLAFITKGRRFLKNAIRTYVLGNRFHDIFGDTPVEYIKEIHEAIQRSHDVLEIRQQISERYLKIGVYICELDGNCSWSNECLNNMFGLDSKEMRGFGWLSAIDSADRKRVHESWMYSIKERISYDENYIVVNKRDNLLIDVSTHAVAVVNELGEIQCYVGYLIVNKVTDTKNATQ